MVYGIENRLRTQAYEKTINYFYGLLNRYV